MEGNSFLFYAAVMLLAGLGIPVMAALNGGLGVQLQNPTLATTFLLIIGAACSALVLLISGNIPQRLVTDIPVYFYFGGFFVIFYILSITWIGPKFGIGNAVSFVLLGQLISMAAIDHFRWLGAPYHPLSSVRALGIVLMAVGVFLAVRRG